MVLTTLTRCKRRAGLPEASSTPVPLGPRTALVLAETRYAPGAILATHHHDRPTLSLVFQGAYQEEVGARAHECPVFSLVYKPAQISHSNTIGGKGLHGLFVEIPSEHLPTAVDGRLPPNAVCIRSLAVRGLVARVAEEFRTRNTAFELSVEGLLLELWAAAAQQTNVERGTPEWLARARDFLHAHFRERISLNQVAEAAGVHPVHLAQVYRRRYGLSIGAYVRELRMEFACHAMADPDPSLSRIAIDAGFADHSHFSRCFRSRTGLTPSRYREMLLEGTRA